MAFYAKIIRWCLLVIAVLFNPAIANEHLTIEHAVEAALQRDTLIHAYQARSQAYKKQSIAEDTLPDPVIKLGMMNFPVDTFSRTQEPMTQIQLGLQQMFPRGNTLEIKSARSLSMANAIQALQQDQKRKIKRDVRKIWLEYFYWINAERVISRNRYFFKKLVNVTRQQYAAGRQKQQDVIRSELELGMLDDRQTKIRNKLEMVQAKLARYIGFELSQRKINEVLPEFPLRKDKKDWLLHHPLLKYEDARVEFSKKGIELSHQSYKPSWMLDVTYGKRDGYNPSGSKRADFVSAMLKFDLPLFTGNRQDQQVAASRQRFNSAVDMREERKRELVKMYQINIANEKRLADRIRQYKSLLIPKAKENAESALYAYQSGRSEFETLMRAQITELETQLRALRLEVDYAKARAVLDYLLGDAA